ncbi:hypothetical protein DL95DRAFT_408332 [Leptodontidium sp. 2 PMI_412]|nr:hypothetical protein DL95DRAFT_408332 [Leptodontidium sp. 2 PMI_412]
MRDGENFEHSSDLSSRTHIARVEKITGISRRSITSKPRIRQQKASRPRHQARTGPHTKSIPIIEDTQPGASSPIQPSTDATIITPPEAFESFNEGAEEALSFFYDRTIALVQEDDDFENLTRQRQHQLQSGVRRQNQRSENHGYLTPPPTQGGDAPSEASTNNNENDDIFADINASFYNFISTYNDEEHEQIIDMISQADILYDDSDEISSFDEEAEFIYWEPYIPRDPLAEIHSTYHTHARLRNGASRRTEEEALARLQYLRDAIVFDPNGWQIFTPRGRENIPPSPEMEPTTLTAITDSNVDGDDSWIELESLREALPIVA